MTREERREQIAAHLAADTCWICSAQVLQGHAVHGPTGAHWDCHAAKFDVVGRNGLPTDPATLRQARANGGYRYHWVDRASGQALCGHKPKDTASKMRQRGRWIYGAPTETVAAKWLCLVCQSRYEAHP